MSIPPLCTTTCSVLWFPHKSHVELEINGKLYNLFFGLSESIRDLSKQKNTSFRNEDASFYRFYIALTASEKQRLLEELNPNLSPHTCSGNIARLLAKVTGATFPWFKSWLPSTFAKHLYQMRYDPHSRVYKIKYMGQDPDAEISQSFSEGYYSDVSLAASMAFDFMTSMGEMARGEAIPGL